MARNNLQLPHVVGEDLPRVFGTLEDIPMTQKLREHLRTIELEPTKVRLGLAAASSLLEMKRDLVIVDDDPLLGYMLPILTKMALKKAGIPKLFERGASDKLSTMKNPEVLIVTPSRDAGYELTRKIEPLMEINSMVVQTFTHYANFEMSSEPRLHTIAVMNIQNVHDSGNFYAKFWKSLQFLVLTGIELYDAQKMNYFMEIAKRLNGEFQVILCSKTWSMNTILIRDQVAGIRNKVPHMFFNDGAEAHKFLQPDMCFNQTQTTIVFQVALPHGQQNFSVNIQGQTIIVKTGMFSYELPLRYKVNLTGIVSESGLLEVKLLKESNMQPPWDNILQQDIEVPTWLKRNQKNRE